MKLTKEELSLISHCERNAERARGRWQDEQKLAGFTHPDDWESTKLCKIIRRLSRTQEL